MYQEIQHSFEGFLREKNDPRLISRKLNIGTAIKQLRKLEKVSIAEIIKKTGIKRTAINSTIHLGECNTSYDKLVKTTQALNVYVFFQK